MPLEVTSGPCYIHFETDIKFCYLTVGPGSRLVCYCLDFKHCAV